MNDEDKLLQLFESDDGRYFMPKPKRHVTTNDERLIESFAEITKFIQKNGHTPSTSATNFDEVRLGKRLEGIKSDSKKASILKDYDEEHVLEQLVAPKTLEELFESKDAEKILGGDLFDVSKLPNAGRMKNVGDTATRKRVDDFDEYDIMFKEHQAGLSSGKYILIKFLNQWDIRLGGYYVSNGQMCYVDAIGEQKEVFGRAKERMTVIFENGTESDIYLRTLSSQLYNGGYMVVTPAEAEEITSKRTMQAAHDSQLPTTGYVYVLKSKSKNPQIQMVKNLYKIGVTRGTTPERIKNAAEDPTYLMSEVETVANYRLTGDYNPMRVEDTIHRFFADAQLSMNIISKNGEQYTPKEWYCVPIDAIDEAISLINSGEIINYFYDRTTQTIKEIA